MRGFYSRVDAYLAHLRTLANSAAAPPDCDDMARYDWAKVSGTVTSQLSETLSSAPRDQCRTVRPPAVRTDKTMRLLRCRDISLGECPEDNIVDKVMPCDPPNAFAA